MKKRVTTNIILFLFVQLCFAQSKQMTIGNWRLGSLYKDDSTFSIALDKGEESLFTDSTFTISANRGVGIGTPYPKQRLHVVDGNILISKTSKKTRSDGSINGSILFGADVDEETRRGVWGIEYFNTSKSEGGLNFWKVWDPISGGRNFALYLRNNGNVGIGTDKPQYKLDVYGTIRAREILVDLKGVGGADFVFSENYRLPKLSEVSDFVNKNKHLPDIPSEKEMIESGISINELQIKLLQKIEELTLYVIEQEKKIQHLEEQLNNK